MKSTKLFEAADQSWRMALDAIRKGQFMTATALLEASVLLDDDARKAERSEKPHAPFTEVAR